LEGIIKKLKNQQNEYVLPVTSADAVYMVDGTTTVGASLAEIPNQLELKRDKTVKLEQADLSETLQAQIAGTAGLLSIPQDGSVTGIKTNFMSVGKNLFNKSAAEAGYYVSETTGNKLANASYNCTEYIPVQSDTNYAVNVTNRIAWYDANKVFISGLYYVAGDPLKSPVNAKFFRGTMTPATIDTYQFEKGTVSTVYEPFNYFLSPSVLAEKIITNKMLNEKIVDVNKTDFIVIGKNLFNKDTVTTGHYVNHANGNISVNVSYDASDYIEIEPDTNYTTNYVYYLAFYDENKIFISGLNNGYTNTFKTPVNAKYLRITITPDLLDALQIEKGTSSTEYQPFGYVINKGLYQIANTASSFVIDGCIAPNIPAIIGKEVNIYFENILNDRANKYLINVICNIGKQQNERWICVPDAAGTYPMTIEIYKDFSLVTSVTTSVVVKNASVGNGVNKKMLVIGDSTTANSIALTEVANLFSTDVMDISLIGTKGTAPVQHEGVSGWTTNHFYTNIASPFVFSGVFDFAQYMATNGYSGLNYVVINLGINDVFGYTDDATLNAQITAILAQYQSIIDNIKAYDANIKIGLGVTIPPNNSQDAFGEDSGCSQTRWRYKRNNYIWAKALINQFKNKEVNGIYLIPLNVNIDTEHNMGSQSVAVNARNTDTVVRATPNSGIHPAYSGYYQIADIYYYWLKSFES
jgi:hypothetical protein